MIEPVSKCEHPKMFYSKRAGKEIYVSCGKCLACRQARQARWVKRIQEESKCHMYTQVILLEYDDLHIPKFDFSDDGLFLVDNTPRLQKYYQDNPGLNNISLTDLIFKDDAERNYVLDRLNGSVSALPHPSVYDIQIFKKRLATKIKRQILGRYRGFRSCIVAEIGSTTFRPHYHGILFFDDERILKELPRLVRECWTDSDGSPLGFSKVEADRGHFASYIAKYITKPADIPQIYEMPGFKPFFLTSRHPPIGSLLHGAQNRYIFDQCYPETVEICRDGGQYIPKLIPIGQARENMLFPRCPLYSKVSVRDRTVLYKMIFDGDGLPFESYSSFFNTLLDQSLVNTEHTLFDYTDFEDKLVNLKVDLDLGHFVWKNTVKAKLVRELCGDFSTECSFHMLFSCGLRIIHQSNEFNVSFNDYLDKIYKYHDHVKPIYQLRKFYRLQDQKLFEDPDFDLRFFYPLTYYRSGYHPEESEDSVHYHEDLKQRYYESTKNHRKNAYFESRRMKAYDYNLYLTIKNYYYAKECHEALEAIA